MEHDIWNFIGVQNLSYRLTRLKRGQVISTLTLCQNTEVVPSSSLVEIEVEVEVKVEVGVEVEVGIGGAGVGVWSLRWVVEDEVEGKHMSK